MAFPTFVGTYKKYDTKEKISLGNSESNRQHGTNTSSLKIYRLLTSGYKTLHLLFMYVCAIFIYWSISVRVYIVVQSDFLPSINADASEGYSILPNCGPYILTACLWLDTNCTLAFAPLNFFHYLLITPLSNTTSLYQTPWSRVLLLMKKAAQLVKIFHAFSGTGRSATVYRRTRQSCLLWAS
jgi:hypothetical protein